MKFVTDYVYAPRVRYGWSGPRDELLGIIDELLSRVPAEQRAGAVIELETVDEYDSNYIEMKVAYTRPPTEEEVRKEKEGKARDLAWKRAQLERLKKELGE